MKGQSRNSGPPPDPNALRRSRDIGDWKVLPAQGRQKPPPAWPLVTVHVTPRKADDEEALIEAQALEMELAQRELHLWDDLWSRPQAIVWEELGLEYEVALYVRRFTEAERSYASTALGQLVKQMQENLGLSVAGLARHRWKIQPLEAEEERRTASASAGTVANRFKVVGGTDTEDG